MKNSSNDKRRMHLRINDDKLICHRLNEAKRILRTQQKRSDITDREALRFLLANTNNGNPSEVIDTQVKIMKHTYNLYITRLRNFPFTQLSQIMNLVTDEMNLLSVDEVKQGFMNIIAQGNVNLKKTGEKKHGKK